MGGSVAGGFPAKCGKNGQWPCIVPAVSSARRTAVLAAMAMLAVGLACEVVVFTTFGANSLADLGTRVLRVLGGYTSLESLGRIATMTALLVVVAARWPRWSTTFVAGPLLGLAAWYTGILSGIAWSGDWSLVLDSGGFLAVIGSVPAAFVGTVMPNVAEAIERRHARRTEAPPASVAGRRDAQ
jgi:hypothetical protein